MTTVKYFKWQCFSKVYLKMAVWKEYSFVLSRKKQTECRGFSMGKSSTFFFPPPPHTISQTPHFQVCSPWLHFKEWISESKQLSSSTSGVKNARKYRHASSGPNTQDSCKWIYCIWDFHWWAGLWAYQIITQITAFWDSGYFYSLICKQNFYNKLFLTKSYLENCLYRKPREKVNCSLWKALNYIITVENTGGRR